MSGSTSIEWTDATWNPIVGCSVYSPGCKNCYAMRQAHRLASNPLTPHYHGTTQITKGGPVFTGKVARAPEHVLLAPLGRKKPRRIFVNSMGDLFHESIPDAWIDRVFAVMALCPQHTFQVLTKRAERMRAYFSAREPANFGGADLLPDRIFGAVWTLKAFDNDAETIWPLRNVWLGVSAERQEEADQRIPLLLQTPAAVRFVSAEPLLGPIDLTAIPRHDKPARDAILAGVYRTETGWCEYPRLDWVIVGGESGPHARPMHPDWATSIRDQCKDAGVPFFFKQIGEWAWQGPHNRDTLIGPGGIIPRGNQRLIESGLRDGRLLVTRIGKKAAGRLLDGLEHNGFPEGSVPQQSSPAPDTNKLVEVDA